MKMIEVSHNSCMYKKRDRGGINEMESLEEEGCD